MKVSGIRCSNKDYSFAILSGNKQSPNVIETGNAPYPKSFVRPQSLKWLFQEIEGLLSDHQVNSIVL